MGIETFESKGLKGREELVERIKQKAGELDDLLTEIAKDEDVTVSNGHYDVIKPRIRPSTCHRMTALAKTNLEQAVMWAVKAISRS